MILDYASLTWISSVDDNRVNTVVVKLHTTYQPTSPHPLVYNSTPHPQWSSGYDFRVSFHSSIICLNTSLTYHSCHLKIDKPRETRVRFPVEEHLRI